MYCEWLCALFRLLDLLPRSHLIYLRHVICVLHQIAANSHVNNMTARNLSVCVSQNLLWPPRRHGASEMLNDVSRVSQVCHRLIESAANVFGPRCLELFRGPGPGTSPTVTTDDDSLHNGDVGMLSHFDLFTQFGQDVVRVISCICDFVSVCQHNCSRCSN